MPSRLSKSNYPSFELTSLITWSKALSISDCPSPGLANSFQFKSGEGVLSYLLIRKEGVATLTNLMLPTQAKS